MVVPCIRTPCIRCNGANGPRPDSCRIVMDERVISLLYWWKRDHYHEYRITGTRAVNVMAHNWSSADINNIQIHILPSIMTQQRSGRCSKKKRLERVCLSLLLHPDAAFFHNRKLHSITTLVHSYLLYAGWQNVPERLNNIVIEEAKGCTKKWSGMK